MNKRTNLTRSLLIHTVMTADRFAAIASTYPAIDNHCHNILSKSKHSSPNYPLTDALVESAGTAAAKHAHLTLAFFRASKQLGALYCNDPYASWEDVVKVRDKIGYDGVIEKCFGPSGIACLLLDDLMIGIDENCLVTADHGKFVKHVRRVIRIESVAEVSHYHIL